MYYNTSIHYSTGIYLIIKRNIYNVRRLWFKVTFLPYELRKSSCLFVYLFILCFHFWYILILIMVLSYKSEWNWYFFIRIKIFVQNCRAFWVKSIFYIRGVFCSCFRPTAGATKNPTHSDWLHRTGCFYVWPERLHS